MGAVLTLRSSFAARNVVRVRPRDIPAFRAQFDIGVMPTQPPSWSKARFSTPFVVMFWRIDMYRFIKLADKVELG